MHPLCIHLNFSSSTGKGHFVHFSTVNEMTGDRGLLQTKKMIPHRDFQCLEFFYYHSGHHTDQLNVWIREFEIGDTVGATRLIGQITGELALLLLPLLVILIDKKYIDLKMLFSANTIYVCISFQYISLK